MSTRFELLRRRDAFNESGTPETLFDWIQLAHEMGGPDWASVKNRIRNLRREKPECVRRALEMVAEQIGGKIAKALQNARPPKGRSRRFYSDPEKHDGPKSSGTLKSRRLGLEDANTGERLIVYPGCLR